MTTSEFEMTKVKNRIAALSDRKGLRQLASNKNIIAKLQRKLRALERRYGN